MNQTPMTEMTGYDFVMGVLSLTDFEVAPLVELAGSTETEWLEFKAATTTRRGDEREYENKVDPQWSVAKAVVAMANSSGGAVIIGVKENPTEHVSLNDSGFDGNMDKFKLHIRQHVLSPETGWKTKKAHWSLDERSRKPHYEIKEGTFCGNGILVVLVKPIESDGKPILTNRVIENKVKLPIGIWERAQGDIGQCIFIDDFHKITEWSSKRSLARPYLYEKLEKFKSNWKNNNLADDEVRQLESAIALYAKKAEINIEKDFGLFYTPLDGEEQLSANSAPSNFQQQAIEILENCWESDDPDENNIFQSNSPSIASQFFDQKISTDEINEKSTGSLAQPRRGGILDLVAGETRAVILGDSGSGKSWCLKSIQLEWAKAYKSRGMVVIYLPLSQFRTDLWSISESYSQLTVEQLLKVARDGRLKLLLDGLNECPPQNLAICITHIKVISRDYPKLQILLSSRIRHYENFLNAPIFSISPLTEERQAQYLQNYVTNQQDANTILNHLRHQPGGSELASNPFRLTQAAKIISLDDKTSIYPLNFHRFLLKQWYARELKKASKNKAKVKWAKEYVSNTISELAYYSRKDGYFSDVDIKWVGNFMTEKFGDEATSFLDFIAEGSLLSRSADSAYLRFIHESIQETFAAEFILLNDERWIEIVDSLDSWRMVAAHIVTSGERISDNAVEHLERIDPWLAVCTRPWNPAPLDKVEWTSSSNWLDGACVLAITFAMRDEEWQSSAKKYLFDKSKNTSRLISLIDKGILSVEDFQGEEWDPKLKNWFVANSTSELISALFPANRIRRIAKKCEILEAVDLYKKRLFCKLDIFKVLEDWKSTASLGKAAAMIRDNDLLTWEDFAVRRLDWIKIATPRQAYKWVKAGLANWSEFEIVGISEDSYLTTNRPISILATVDPNADCPAKISQDWALQYAFEQQITVPALVQSFRTSGYGVLVCGHTAFLPRAKSGFPYGGYEMVGRKIDVLLWEMKDEPLVIWANYHTNYRKIEQANSNKFPVQGRIVKKMDGGYGVDCDGIWTFLPDKHMPIHLSLNFLHVPSDDNNTCELQNFLVDDIYLPNKDTNKSIQVCLADTSDDVDFFLSLEALHSAYLAASPVEGIISVKSDHEVKVSFGLGISSSIKIDGLVRKSDMSFIDSLSLGSRVSCLIRNVSFFSGKIVIDIKNITKPVDEKYKPIAANGFDLEVGKLFKGVIIDVKLRGYIVEIASGTQGLLRKSEMPKFIRQDILNINEVIEVIVCEPEISSEEIIFKIADSFFSHISIGSEFIGIIYKIADYGLFIEIKSNITGLLHKNHFSQDMRVRKYRRGDKIRVEVKGVDLVKGEISLTLPTHRLGIGQP